MYFRLGWQFAPPKIDYMYCIVLQYTGWGARHSLNRMTWWSSVNEWLFHWLVVRVLVVGSVSGEWCMVGDESVDSWLWWWWVNERLVHWVVLSIWVVDSPGDIDCMNSWFTEWCWVYEWLVQWLVLSICAVGSLGGIRWLIHSLVLSVWFTRRCECVWLQVVVNVWLVQWFMVNVWITDTLDGVESWLVDSLWWWMCGEFSEWWWVFW